jgi:hypothetical protein
MKIHVTFFNGRFLEHLSDMRERERERAGGRGREREREPALVELQLY